MNHYHPQNAIIKPQYCAEEHLQALVGAVAKHWQELGSEVMAFIEDQLGLAPTIRPGELAKRIAERFGISVHRRRIERALSHKKKKRSEQPRRE